LRFSACGLLLYRNTLLAIGTLILALPSPASAQSLRELADRAGILVGTAVRPSQFSETAYAATLGREFNLLEPEDAMKWWVIRPDPATFAFTQGDQIVAFAETHRMKVRGHTLVWGWSNPPWLLEGHFTPAQLSTMLQEHIQKVVTHYRGQVFAWDVVNEAFEEHGNLKDSVWYNRPGIGLAGKGTAYLEQVFQWAHAADPAALLFYNDAEGETLNAKSDAIYAMVKDFKRRRVPIDGVGLQMHLFDLNSDLASIEANIARFTALGVQVHITEMDVALPTAPNGEALKAADLERQSEIYGSIARACLSHPGCTAIQTWGFTDKYSWIRSKTKGTKGAALPFDRNYVAKPACLALKQALASAKPQK
jgi:endo-1,4-beta-xylanase